MTPVCSGRRLLAAHHFPLTVPSTPSPSAGGGAHRPLTPSCPPSPSAWPIPPPPRPPHSFPLVGWSPRTVPVSLLRVGPTRGRATASGTAEGGGFAPKTGYVCRWVLLGGTHRFDSKAMGYKATGEDRFPWVSGGPRSLGSRARLLPLGVPPTPAPARFTFSHFQPVWRGAPREMQPQAAAGARGAQHIVPPPPARPL